MGRIEEGMDEPGRLDLLQGSARRFTVAEQEERRAELETMDDADIFARYGRKPHD